MVDPSTINPDTGVSLGLLATIGGSFLGIIGWILKLKRDSDADIKELRDEVRQNYVDTKLYQSERDNLIDKIDEMSADIKQLLVRRSHG